MGDWKGAFGTASFALSSFLVLQLRLNTSRRFAIGSMRTRNTDAAKSGATKKTLPPKKGVSAAATDTAEKTPDAAPKSTLKSGAKTRAAGKQSASKAAASAPVAATPDPNPEPKVEELATSAEEPVATTAKSSAKKSTGGKAKAPPGKKASLAATPKVEEAAEEQAAKVDEEVSKEEVKEEVEEDNELKVETVVTDVKDTEDNDPIRNEEDSAVADQQQMEENVEQEEFVEPGEEEFMGVEEDVGVVEGEEACVGMEEEEDPQIEDDEQIEISDMAKRRKMKKEQEIFVGGLDRDAVEEDLKMAFEKVGEVIEIRLHKDFLTNKNKGFAFVKFANKEQAARALSELKNPVIRGKRCGIAPSEDNDTLFLGNICNTWTKEAIKRKLKDYGVDGVENITLVLDTQNEGLSRGFAFLEFSCHEDAMLAYKRLQKPDVIFGHAERTAKVAFAEPLREPDPEVMAQVKSVFVDGLPPFWDEDQVKEQFKGYGDIERVVLARNMSTSKRKDFGFVNFTTHEAAVACVEGINNTELGDGKSKMKVRARLANPLPKTQAVKGGMSGGYRIGYTGVGVYTRFGRGFGRGRFSSFRAGFQSGRGFNFRGRGRGGRFSFAADGGLEGSSAEFQFRRPFGHRGGRGFPMSGRHGTFRGRGQVFSSRRPPFMPEEEFGRPFGGRYVGPDPYFYGGAGHGIKRPFSTMDHDYGYMEPGSRIRPRYDNPDPMPMGPRHRDSLTMSGLYSRDYYGSDYGGSSYSSYGGEHSGRGYYY